MRAAVTARRPPLDRLEPAPALLCNHATDILAYTVTYELLAGPLGVLDGENPNLVRYLFADPRAKKAFPDWDRVADEHLKVLTDDGPDVATGAGAKIPDDWPVAQQTIFGFATLVSSDVIEYTIEGGEVIATYGPAAQPPPGCD
jgi:MmyB-like transcription regulator ligand binding domain